MHAGQHVQQGGRVGVDVVGDLRAPALVRVRAPAPRAGAGVGVDRQRSPQRYDDHLCCLLRQHDADRAGHDGGQSGLPVERPDREIASRLERVALAPLLAGAAFLGVLRVPAPPGPGLVPADSLASLGPATLLAHGEGLRLPAAQWWSADSTATLVRYPPGMAVALALPIAAGLTPTTAHAEGPRVSRPRA